MGVFFEFGSYVVIQCAFTCGCSQEFVWYGSAFRFFCVSVSYITIIRFIWSLNMLDSGSHACCENGYGERRVMISISLNGVALVLATLFSVKVFLENRLLKGGLCRDEG